MACATSKESSTEFHLVQKKRPRTCSLKIAGEVTEIDTVATLGASRFVDEELVNGHYDEISPSTLPAYFSIQQTTIVFIIYYI